MQRFYLLVVKTYWNNIASVFKFLNANNVPPLYFTGKHVKKGEDIGFRKKTWLVLPSFSE